MKTYSIPTTACYMLQANLMQSASSSSSINVQSNQGIDGVKYEPGDNIMI